VRRLDSTSLVDAIRDQAEYATGGMQALRRRWRLATARSQPGVAPRLVVALASERRELCVTEPQPNERVARAVLPAIGDERRASSRP
jgi:hypothetical protein